MATGASAANNEIVQVRAVPADLIEDLQRVQKAAQRITSILDLDQLIHSVVNEVTLTFGCVEASIYLHDEEFANGFRNLLISSSSTTTVAFVRVLIRRFANAGASRGLFLHPIDVELAGRLAAWV
jgi:hypothetical protein